MFAVFAWLLLPEGVAELPLDEGEKKGKAAEGVETDGAAPVTHELIIIFLEYFVPNGHSKTPLILKHQKIIFYVTLSTFSCLPIVPTPTGAL